MKTIKSSISDFSAVRTSVELQQQHSVEISNRFAALDDNIFSVSIQDGYEKIIEIVEKQQQFSSS